MPGFPHQKDWNGSTTHTIGQLRTKEGTKVSKQEQALTTLSVFVNRAK